MGCFNREQFSRAVLAACSWLVLRGHLIEMESPLCVLLILRGGRLKLLQYFFVLVLPSPGMCLSETINLEVNLSKPRSLL